MNSNANRKYSVFNLRASNDIALTCQRVIANKVKQSPIRTDCFPEISGQAVPRNDDEKSYPLPSALADGHGSQHQRDITPTRRVTSNSVKHCASSPPAAGRCETLCNQMV